MGVDPQVQSVLDRFAQSARGAALPSVEALRIPNPAIMAMRWSAVDIASVSNLEIPGPDGALRARLYATNNSSPAPTVVYFHGGGWVAGSIDNHDGFCRHLAKRSRCAVLSVDYRLAPEHRFPAAVNDAVAVVRWASAHGRSVGIDNTKLAVAGDSAGGNLAAVVPLVLREEDAPSLAAQILLFPITDHEFDSESMLASGEGFFLTREGMMWYWSQYLEDERFGDDWRASPLRAPDLSGLPPATVLVAEFDPLRTQAEQYAQRLVAAGVDTDLHCFDGMIHSFANLRQAIDRAEEAMDVVVAAVRRQLGTVPS